MGDSKTVTHRFFRSSEQVYESARATIDAAWGLPASGQQTCIEPAVTAPRDGQGRIVLAVNADFCAYSVVIDLLPQLLASGAATEITEAEYRAARVP
jgi:hypothetical protein